ncbi:hypothetical protein HDV03_004138 [Kappamyces sp. JEL0829]|nr:hypothetical protein HDV03_004138 [Kappamyces sp. JEL0829]
MATRKGPCAFLGPIGTYSHQAALNFAFEASDLVPHETIASLFTQSTCSWVVCPIENTTGGSVAQTLDSIYRAWKGAEGGRRNLVMKDQTLLTINHCLLKRRDCQTISKIYSHPEALAQCSAWLSRNMRGAQLVPCASTSLGAKMASLDATTACISSQLCADLYDLEIVSANLAPSGNSTRFVLLTLDQDISQLEPKIPGLDYETVVMIKCDRQLSLAMRVLSQLTLSRVFVRPIPLEHWNNVYYVVIVGHASDAAFQQQMQELEDARLDCLFIVGSYPSNNRN